MAATMKYDSVNPASNMQSGWNNRAAAAVSNRAKKAPEPRPIMSPAHTAATIPKARMADGLPPHISAYRKISGIAMIPWRRQSSLRKERNANVIAATNPTWSPLTANMCIVPVLANAARISFVSELLSPSTIAG